MKYFTIGLLFLLLMQACTEPAAKAPLPIIGNKEIVGNDTIYHTIPDFNFIDQDSQEVNNETFKDKAYVVDFFFISCPTICPKTTKQMLRLHDKFINEKKLVLMAHSIDPKRDTVGALKHYAKNLDINTNKWHLVTGDKDELFDIANYYFSVAMEDAESPGGFDHSGRLILIDKNRRVRSFCDGTDPKDVDRFMEDIQTLLDEM